MMAYFAGLFDGEGSIHVASKSGRGFQLSLHVVLTSHEPLYQMEGWLGGAVHKHNSRTKGGFESKQWTVSGVEAQEILRKLYPHLIIKKEEADVALKFPVMIKGGTPGVRGSPKISDEDHEYRQYLAQQLKDLKKPR